MRGWWVGAASAALLLTLAPTSLPNASAASVGARCITTGTHIAATIGSRTVLLTCTPKRVWKVHSTVVKGNACPRIDLTAKVRTTRLICSRSGARLVWSPAPRSTPVPSPTATPTATPTPPAPVVPASRAEAGDRCDRINIEAVTMAGPIRCVDEQWTLIAESDDSVSSRAFRFTLTRYLNRPEAEVSLAFTVDPQTPEWWKQIELGIRAGARLWGTSRKDDAPLPILISANGRWIRGTASNLGLQGDLGPFIDRDPCNNAGLVGNPMWLFFCFGADQTTVGAGFRQVPSHEYTHVAQRIWSRGGGWIFPWMDEGLPSITGSFLGPMSGMGNDIRNSWVPDLNGIRTPLSFFASTAPEVFSSDRWGEVYAQGAIAVEGMIALFGIDAMERLYVLRSNGLTAEQAMREVTGAGPAHWSDVMQGYVDSVRGSNPWTLAQLRARAAMN